MTKRLCLLFYIILLSLSSPLFSKTILQDCNSPESVYIDKSSQSIFVSCIHGEGNKKDGIGHIARLNFQREIINPKWITGLNAPKGMRSSKGNLWVSDIDRVIKINIKTGKIIETINIKGANFLNDIAIDRNENIYISDTLNSSIYKITNLKPTLFMQGKNLLSPNGLLVIGNSLIVASWGYTTDWTTKIRGHLYSINLKNKKIKYITKSPLGNLDGIEVDIDNNFIVSDWVSGKLFKVNRNGNTQLIHSGEKGLADFAFIKSKRLILAPLMLSNKVIEIKL